MNSHDKLEAICIDAWKNGIHFKVVDHYNPPNNVPDLERIAGISSHHNTIIMGNFNSHSTRWGYSNTSGTGKAVEKLLDNSALIRIPSRPTLLSYGCHSRTPHTDLNSCKPVTQNFKKVRLDGYSQLSDEYATGDLINDNPDKSYELFFKGILREDKESIPSGQVKKHLSFWNECLDLLKSERNAARCRAENSHNIANCILLRKAQAKLKRAIILSKTFRSFAANLDFRKYDPRANRFVSYLNNEKSSQHSEPIPANGKLLTIRTEIATALSKNYAAISRLYISARDRKAIYDKGPAPSPTEQDSPLLNKDFSYDELLFATNALKKGKFAGPDRVFLELIINLGSKVLRTFLKHINLTWKTRVPHQGRKAEVISLLKKGKPTNNLDSCRSISLISVCCKVAEKMVECKLREFLESKCTISDCQAGFRRHRSSMDKFMKLTQAVKYGFC
ncbi:hypothetical protein TNCT_9161 [Trichonephila clavata]|uniref:Endonuclease/exonuclease/phosphatase domain-containing protein n=1 Tax=Trichonephila clavata TaxID=2740835 RepID=A0A8X6FQF2_TRICU|nr:hypothetical protein TNCT_9161 [Trichonephila clavata]